MFKKIKSALTNTKKTLEKREAISQLKEQSKSKAAKRSKRMRPADVSYVRVKHPLKQEEFFTTHPVEEPRQEIVTEEPKQEVAVEAVSENADKILSDAEAKKYLVRLYMDGIMEGIGIGIIVLSLIACNSELRGIFTTITIDFLALMFYLALRLTLRAIKDVFGKFVLNLENGANIRSNEEPFAVFLSAILTLAFIAGMAIENLDFFGAFCLVFSVPKLSGIIVFVILDIACVYGVRAIRNTINGLVLDKKDES